MFGMRRWLRSNTAKVYVAALVGIVVMPMAQACPMPMTAVSMAYANAEMPETCAGLAKQACLLSYIQADRATRTAGATIATHPAAILRVAPPTFIALAQRDGGLPCLSAHSGAPPPRLRFCRMLQ